VAVIAEVLRCVARHGFRRIAVLTGHGGNRPAIELAMAEIARERADGPDGSIRIALFRDHGDEVFSRRSREALAGEKPEGRPGIHAARWETAETLADRPELVRRDRIDADRPPEMPVGVPEWTWLTHEIAPTGATGDPSVATAEFGCKAWAAWAEAFASFLKRLAEAPL